MLKVENINVYYGNIHAIKDIATKTMALTRKIIILLLLLLYKFFILIDLLKKSPPIFLIEYQLTDNNLATIQTYVLVL